MFKKIEFKKLPDNEIISLNKLSIAIIIPHQNNIKNLQKLLTYIQKKSDHRIDIFIIDQNNADKFNRGLLLNIGYLIAIKNFSYDRYIFHNVNYFPNEEMFDSNSKFINYNICFNNFESNSEFEIQNKNFESNSVSEIQNKNF